MFVFFFKNLHVISFLGIFSLLGIAMPCVAENALAGKVIYVSDKLFAVSPDHLTRSIKRGASFYQGDILKTSELSSAQLRFLDDTVVALRPETEFRIDVFSYTKEMDTQLQNAPPVFRGSLLKGSLRTIAGHYAEKAGSLAWVLDTSVATVTQEQGANYELVLGDAGLAVAVWEGSLIIENKGGRITLGGDSRFSYALITDVAASPEGLQNPPDLAVLNTKNRIGEESGSDSSSVDTSVNTNIEKQEQQN